MHVSEAEVATGVAVGQPLVINSQEMKNSRLKIVDGDYVLRDVITQFITCTMNLATFNSCTGKPRTVYP